MAAPDTAPNSEWPLLLAACSMLPPSEKRARLMSLLTHEGQHQIRWPALFALAEHHGTQPLLLQSLLDVEHLVPALHLNSLKQACQFNIHKSLFLSRELIRIACHLSAIGLEVMPYKGVALAELLYGDIAMRQSSDIDLLIRPEDLGRIRRALGDLGYVPHEIVSQAHEWAYLKSGYECAFDGAAGPNLLELQWGILPRFYAVDFDIAGLFDRAMNINVAGQPMKGPSPSDLFLILSAHAAKHVWGRLAWLCDIACLMGLPDMDWGWIWSQANEMGIRRILQVTMFIANRLLEAKIPDAARAGYAEDSVVEALAAEVQLGIADEGLYKVESPAYFRFIMRLRERNSDRLRFLLRLALTPGPGEWNAIRLPEPLFPLYRVVRISRLAARLVRA